ncbi:MAG: hypothetical protein CENE_01195 [Candidatus Celerinatantimonas neptuna]|nr:MAG: hypothetical protein CENE_01195 [Candidatus Celerinatantimonas neptuna]
MGAQQLLCELALSCRFDQANQMMVEPDYKNLFKSWLSLMLCYQLASLSGVLQLVVGPRYQCESKSDEWLRFDLKTQKAQLCLKNRASIADIGFIRHRTRFWVEVRSLHQQQMDDVREMMKLIHDYKRVEALQKEFMADQLIVFIGWWGKVPAEKMHIFQALDNNRRSTYLLDSALSGSTQVARLSHMQRDGESRFCLLAYAPTHG